MLPNTSHSFMSSPSQDRLRGLGSSVGPSGVHSTNIGSSTWGMSTNSPANAGGGFGIGQGLGDSLAQSRPQYQPGYLLSMSQAHTSQQSGQRLEESHLIPTRAKMNSAFPRSTSDFGTESLFESKHRHREQMDDEDGPPMDSVMDIVSGVPSGSFAPRPKPLGMSTRSTGFATSTSTPPTHQYQTLYIIVFGFPPARASVTMAHFQSLSSGGTTEPESLADVENAFKIGYKQPWEAARAVRKNGEVVSGDAGRWMVGVKWVDAQLAEQVLGVAAKSGFSPVPLTTLDSSTSSMGDVPMDTSSPSLDPTFSQLQRINTPKVDTTPTIGTPIKLGPAAAAFKRTGGGSDSRGTESGRGAQKGVLGQQGGTSTQSKGVMGQVSEMIFGW